MSFLSKMIHQRITLIGLFLLLLSIACSLGQNKTPSQTQAPGPTPTQSVGILITLEADLPPGAVVNDAEMNAAVSILENRIRGLGYQHFIVSHSSHLQIEVNIVGDSNLDQVLPVLKQTGLLEFVDMSSISQSEVYAMLNAGDPIVTDLYSTQTISSTQPVWHTIMTGADIKTAQVSQQNGLNQVSFELTEAGAQIFKDFTSTHIDKVLAIVLDKKVISAPTINSAILDGKGVISGNFTAEKANLLAIQLRYGALPIPLKVVQTNVYP